MSKTKLSEEIRALGLEQFVLDLEVDGVTIVPPEVHGVGPDRVDEMVDWLLGEAARLVGCEFSLERGPHGDLVFPPNPGGLSNSDGENQPSQFLIQQLGRHHRIFRDLAVNPVALALIRHMIGQEATRFSSHNSFIKWQGARGYGPTLGLHADQSASPKPWGRPARNANTNWCLTDYSKDGGAFAYVPGSHDSGTNPVQPQAAEAAVPAECPKGSLIVFHGAVWHGAFPRLIPGMRLSIANYYRHSAVMSQEDIHWTFPRELADDCDAPEEFKKLAGFDDKFPYHAQTQPIPRAVEAG